MTHPAMPGSPATPTVPAIPYFPAYHVAPEHGWINDPNGLVYFNGEWHLFYQYYEPAQVDGMQWGHAVSADLVHWQPLPPALAPDSHGQIWSGSAVVDHDDTSGLFGGRPGIVCIFTYWDAADGRQCQGLAYSADGRRFEKFAGNPIIPQLRHLVGHPDDKDFRDPKVFWHAATGQWVMAVAGGKLRIFTSADLLHWRFESVADDLSTECPDLFEMPVAGDPARTRWILSGGGRWYMVGDFDGRRFTPETSHIPFGGGPDFYATQTWNDAPGGRRVGISWLYGWGYESGPRAGAIRNPFPTGPWAGGCLTVPCELALGTTPQGPRLTQRPVAELAALRTSLLAEIEGRIIRPEAGRSHLGGVRGQALDIELECSPAEGATVALRFPANAVATAGATGKERAGGRKNASANADAAGEETEAVEGAAGSYTVGYDAGKKVLFIDRRKGGFGQVPHFAERYEAPLAPRADGGVALRILLDRCSVEVFGGDGRTMLSAFVLPDPSGGGLDLFVEGGECKVDRLAVWGMGGAGAK